MSLRGLAVLTLLLAAALAAIFWLDRSAPAPGQGGVGLGAVLDVPLDDVAAFEIGGAIASCRIARKGEKGWAIVEPFEADADPGQVGSFLEGLANARVLRVAEEKLRDPAAFGLDAAATVIRVERRTGGGPRLLRVGRHSPVGPERYVARDDARVLLADFGGTSVERAPESFRERRLFPIQAEEIRRIALTRPGGPLVLAREESSWRLKEPVNDVADYGLADGLARNVAGLSYARFLPEGGTSRGSSTAMHGEIVITVETKEGSAKAEIGPANERNERHAGTTGAGWTGIVASSDVADLTRSAEEYREHRPVLFSASDLRGVRIQGGAILLHAFREKDGRSWSVQEHHETALPAAGAEIDELVDRLRWIRASRVSDAPRAAFSPVLAIDLEGEGQLLGRLELDGLPPSAAGAGAVDDAGATLRARSSWRPGCLFEVPLSQLAGLPRRAADLAAAGGAGSGERKP